jgi:hypothetical protein
MLKAFVDFQTWGQAKKGMLSIYTVPTMGAVELFFLPKWQELFGEFRGLHWDFKLKEKIVTFPNDGHLIIRSAGEPDAIRGGELARIYMDEAASLAVPDQEPLFRVGIGRIRQKGFGPNQICVVTTPQQTRRWITQRWRDGINPLTRRPHTDPRNYELYTASSADNPHLDAAYKADLIAEYADTRYGRQEMGGESLSVEGLLFDDIPERAFVDPPDGTYFKRKAYGIDFGLVDPTAIIEWSLDEGNRAWATDEFYERNAREESWVKWLGERHAKRVFCDPSASKDQIAYWRKRYGINIEASRAKSFGDRLNLWRPNEGLNLGRTIFVTRKAPNLQEELQELAQKQTRNGDWVNEMASGVSDHAYDSASYGLEGLRRISGRPIPSFTLTRV